MMLTAEYRSDGSITLTTPERIKIVVDFDPDTGVIDVTYPLKLQDVALRRLINALDLEVNFAGFVDGLLKDGYFIDCSDIPPHFLKG